MKGNYSMIKAVDHDLCEFVSESGEMLWVSQGWCPQLWVLWQTFGSSWTRRSHRFARSFCSASWWVQLLTATRAAWSAREQPSAWAGRNAVQNSSEKHSKGEQMQEERGPIRGIMAREIWDPSTELQLVPCRAFLFCWMRTNKVFSQQTLSLNYSVWAGFGGRGKSCSRWKWGHEQSEILLY